MINLYGWQGLFKIRTLNKLTGKFEEETIFNRVMDTALDELLDVLYNNAPDMEIKYLALGTSSIAVADNQTQLGSEIFRAPYTSRSKTSVGELTTVFDVLDSEGVGLLEEIGIFGGSTATADANTGKMISRVLWKKNKTALEEIQFTRIDRMVRA
jgi:hypothetical protein